MSKKLVTHEDGPYSTDNGKLVYMAKLIMGAGEDETVVYLDGDPQNNRRTNLKVVKTSSLSE